jgi:transformation/transcription domain-associated protein
MKGAMLDFYPLVMDSIKIQPEPQRKAHEEAKERGGVFVGVAAGIQNREMYTELIKAQVKAGRFASCAPGIYADQVDYGLLGIRTSRWRNREQ